MQISRAHDLMAKALDNRALRQDLISSNISNADTPFYRPRDVNFENHLAAKAQEIFHAQKPRLELAVTHAMHIQPKANAYDGKPTVFVRDGHQARNDGNSVDLDVETTEMAKNSTMFNALVAALKKDGAIFKSVIDSSSKMQ
ncbi:MAG: flagellar basal body rod protein FlgB [Sulfuricurvum sp. PC08-66]|nr:MAG: flagellar basal body rod protein FlgB [Sulfuricurvum sp. PC08-66]